MEDLRRTNPPVQLELQTALGMLQSALAILDRLGLKAPAARLSEVTEEVRSLMKG